MPQLRILLLAASPPDNDKVFVDEFKDVIQTAVTNHLFDVDYKSSSSSSSSSDPQPPIVLHANLRCQVADVQPELLRFRPHIVHFYAHMNVEEVVLMSEGTLEAEQQRSDALHKELLTQIITTHIADVRCVLLTGCSSQAMGRRLIAEASVPSVVLTTTEVHYVACQVYCAEWYAAVFAGHCVGQAAGHAQNQLEADSRTRHLGGGIIQQAGDEDLVLLPALHPTGPARARIPDKFHIPRRDIEYIKRPRVWRELRKGLLELGRRRFVVLTGLGGVGKSQLALEYITDTLSGNDRYRFIAWFAAENPSQLVGAYLDLAEQFMGPAGAELKGKSEDVVVSAVKTWLERQQFWLLVYDNATSWDAIVKYLPQTTQSRTQHIIVTSRHQDWPTQCSKVEVGEMELSECVELVKAVGDIKEHDRSQNVDIYVLADRLGRLPLALSQAAAYIARQAVRVRTYIDAYERLLVQQSTSSLPTGDPHEIVAITWDVTMSVLRTEMEKRTPPLPPLGHILLTVCAYLAPDAIPRSLLQRWLDLAYPDLPAGVDMCSVLLGLLRDYSLIQYVDLEKQAIKMHRVLRTVVKHQHESVELEHQPRDVWYPLPGLPWLTNVVRAMNAEYGREWDRIVEKEMYHHQLFPHLELLASCAPTTHALVGEVDVGDSYGQLLHNVGHMFVYQLGQYEKGQKHLLKAMFIFEERYSPNIDKLAMTLIHLGDAYTMLGEYRKAKELLERALIITEATYGPHHNIVAATLHGLSNVSVSLGAYGKAKKLLERALVIAEATYGLHHVKVATTLTSLGNAYASLGDYGKAKELLERALVIKEATYGLHHAQVATTLVNLGDAYRSLGDHGKAKELLERVLPINEATYGLHHAKVATSLTSLGNAYASLGDYGKAKELLERALVINEATYGLHHAQVAATLHGLGCAYGSLGDYGMAKELLERALVIDEATYGLHHVEVAATLTGLGCASASLGDHRKAKELLERALVINEATYGPHHAQVAATLHNLGCASERLTDYRKAKELLERALVIDEATYGLHHANVAATLMGLGNAYASLGDYGKAKELLERALVINEATYGLHHVEVAATLTSLGNAYRSLGEHDKAKELLERALVINEAINGLQHLDVAKSLMNLGSAHGSLGDYVKQQELQERALAIEQALSPTDHIHLADTLSSLGSAYAPSSDYDEQQRLLHRPGPSAEPLTANGLRYRPRHWQPPQSILKPPFHVDGLKWGQWQRLAWAEGDTEADHQFALSKQRWGNGLQLAILVLTLYQCYSAVVAFSVFGLVGWLVLYCLLSSIVRSFVWYISRLVLALWDDPRILDISMQAYVHQMGVMQAFIQTQGRLLNTAPIPMRLPQCRLQPGFVPGPGTDNLHAADLEVPPWVTLGPTAEDAATGSFTFERRLFHQWGVTAQDVRAWSAVMAQGALMWHAGAVIGLLVGWILCFAFGFTQWWQLVFVMLLTRYGAGRLNARTMRWIIARRVQQMPPHSAFKHIEQVRLSTRY